MAMKTFPQLFLPSLRGTTIVQLVLQQWVMGALVRDLARITTEREIKTEVKQFLEVFLFLFVTRISKSR